MINKREIRKNIYLYNKNPTTTNKKKVAKMIRKHLYTTIHLLEWLK